MSALAPVLALSLLLPAAPAVPPESVASFQDSHQLGGFELHRYDDGGGWVQEGDVPKPRSFNGVTSESRTAGASLGGRQVLFRVVAPARTHPGGDRTLTLGVGAPGATELRSWQQRFGEHETPIDLTPDARGVVTAEPVDGKTLLRRYPAGRAGQGRLLATLPEVRQYPDEVLFQYSGYYDGHAQQGTNIDLGYGQDRIYARGANGPLWARYGGVLGPIITPDGTAADRILLSPSGIAVVRTPKGFWRISAGRVEPLSASLFGADRGERVFGEKFNGNDHRSALSVAGDRIAYAIAPDSLPGFEALGVLDLRTGAHSRFTLPPNDEIFTKPYLVGSAAWSWRGDAVYVLRHSQWLSPHQPRWLTVQSVRIADGTVRTLWPAGGRSTPGWGEPRILGSDVHP